MGLRISFIWKSCSPLNLKWIISRKNKKPCSTSETLLYFFIRALKRHCKKNYTKDEILQIIIKEGWSLTQNSFRYLWSFFLSEDEHYGKKKYSPKSASKEKRTTSKANVRHSSENPDVDLLQSDEILNEQKNDADISITESSTLDNEKNEIQGSTNEKLLPENSQENSNQTKSAHFDIPPDTEDL